MARQKMNENKSSVVELYGSIVNILNWQSLTLGAALHNQFD